WGKAEGVGGLARTLAEHAVVFDWRDDDAPEDLEEMLPRPDVVFLALTRFGAGAGAGEASEARLLAALNEGMPVALWPGGPPRAAETAGGGAGFGPLAVRQRLKALLEACELGELPDRLWQTRQSALSQEDQIEWHL